jgi:hypothetical protein
MRDEKLAVFKKYATGMSNSNRDIRRVYEGVFGG